MDKILLFKTFKYPAKEEKHTIEVATLYLMKFLNNAFLKSCPLNRDYQVAYLKISSFLREKEARIS
jgi:hypothetical protein